MKRKSMVFMSAILFASGCAKNPFSKTSQQSANFHPGFLSVPMVTSVSPSSGTLQGGTTVTIQGSGFLSGAHVMIGGSDCLNLAFVSANKMTCKTASHTGGLVDVTIQNPDQQTASLASAFQYFGAANPVAGFDRTIGGGLMTGPGVRLRYTAGSFGNPVKPSGPGVSSKIGLQGVLTQP